MNHIYIDTPTGVRHVPKASYMHTGALVIPVVILLRTKRISSQQDLENEMSKVAFVNQKKMQKLPPTAKHVNSYKLTRQ